MSAFMPNWGLTVQNEADVIHATVRGGCKPDLMQSRRVPTTVASLATEHARAHLMLRWKMDSLDNPYAWGQPNVHACHYRWNGKINSAFKEFLGSPLKASTSATFNTSETAVVPLDLLSDVAGDPNSINSVPLAPGASIISLIGDLLAI